MQPVMERDNGAFDGCCFDLEVMRWKVSRGG